MLPFHMQLSRSKIHFIFPVNNIAIPPFIFYLSAIQQIFKLLNLTIVYLHYGIYHNASIQLCQGNFSLFGYKKIAV